LAKGNNTKRNRKKLGFHDFIAEMLDGNFIESEKEEDH